MNPLDALLHGVVLPGALAAALYLVLSRTPRLARAATTAALGGAYVLGFALLLGLPELVPVDVTQVSPWVGLALVPAALLPRGRTAVTAAVGFAIGLFLGAPLYGSTPAALLAWAALVALTFAVIERGLDRGLAHSDPRGGALATILLVSGAAAAILFADTASLAQTTGALAAAVGALFALGLIKRDAADMRRAAPVIAGVIATNLWSAALYGGGRYDVIALIALAPVAVGLVTRRAPAASTLGAIARPALAAALPVVIASILAGRSYLASEPDEAPSAADETAEGYNPDYGY